MQSVRFCHMNEGESAELLDDFRAMTNLCLRTIRKNQIRTLKQAHRALYMRLRARYPGYNAAIIARAYRVALQLRKHHAQEAKRLVLRFSKLNSRFTGDTLIVNVGKGQQLTLHLKVTDYQQRFIDAWRRGEYTVHEATLTPSLVIVPFEKAATPILSVKDAVAFDVNETNLAGMTASGKLLQVDTGELKRLHDTYYRKREHIQRRVNHKPRLQQRLLTQLTMREHNRVHDTMHKISKQIALETAGCHIVFENLNGIRQRGRIRGRRMKRRLNSWNFARLQALIEYKAKLNGSSVEYVNPWNTSRICSRCGGIIDRFDWFCQNCGLDRHVNAARNILARSKHRMWRVIGSAEGSLMRLTPPDEQYSYGRVDEREKTEYRTAQQYSASLTL